MEAGAPLRIYLTVDVGPALATLPATPDTDSAGDWAPTLHGMQVLDDTLDGLQQRFGTAIPVTWFVRADRRVARTFGDPLAMFRRSAPHVAAARRDELAWMPFPERSADGTFRTDELADTHARIAGEFGTPRCARLGNLSHDDRTMAAFDSLGLEIDCSAVPGRTRRDAGWRVDWSGTPDAPYHPSCADYRRPGTPARRILEVPMHAVTIRAPYDAVPLRRYVNPCFHEELLWQTLDASLPALPHLVCLSHPDELVPQSGGHPMLSYSPRVFAANLERLVAAAGALGRRVSFQPLGDVERPRSPMAAAR